MKHILVIDGNSIINRAFYGVRPLTTTAGKPTNAIFGMVNIITRQLDRLHPDYAAVAFDVHAPTFRHRMYTEYKAGRHPTPEDLLAQFDDAKQILRALGLHVLEVEGYEADDIQGTVARMAHTAKEDTHSYILTGDRDLLQLIDDRISVLLATNKDTLLMDEAAFREAYGIAPQHFVDMKALMGDSSDHIPGVGGIGQKTAGTLISQFHTLDAIYENIEDSRITKGVREKLLRDKDNAYLSRTLATICTEAPIGKTLDELRIGTRDKGVLWKKFTELELASFIPRFGLSASDAQASTPTEAPAVAAADTGEEMPTTGKEDEPVYPMTDEVRKTLGKAATLACLAEGDTLLFSDGTRIWRAADRAAAAPLLRDRSLICFDGKHLARTLHAEEITTPNVVFLDLMLYGYVLNPGKGVPSLPSLFSEFLPEKQQNCKEMFALEAELRQKICEIDSERILDELELPLVPILTSMEEAGLKIDIDGMRAFGEALGELAEELAQRIYMQAGEVFNIQSPKQLGEVLFVKMGLPCGNKKTKNGFSTSAETLEELRGVSPIIEDILEYRQVTKLRSTYATALTEAADEKQRVHTDFKQAMTATGRLSSADPNLQNIPIRTRMGREMRRFFIAEEGYQLVDADYSQIELRLLAHISGDYNMTDAFKNGEDIHRKTAAAVFGIPEEEVTELQRKRAKAVNFGIVYGISGFSLSKDIGTTVAEAGRYIKSYLYNYPMIDAYLDAVVEEAKERGYTVTPMGRRRYIPELKAQNAPMRAFGKRVAMNAPIQGAAADIIKLAMIHVDRRLKTDAPGARLVMQVHDELIVEAPLGEVDTVKRILKEEMESVATLTVPLTVDVCSGKNWLEQE